MEFVKCTACGNEVPSNQPICGRCGKVLRDAVFPPPFQGGNASLFPRVRKGFVSFYIWLGLVVNGMMSILYFISFFTRKGVMSGNEPMSSRIYGFLMSSLLLVGYLMVKRWKKNGFYLLLGTGLMMQVTSFMDSDPVTLIPIYSIALLCVMVLIVHNKDGKTCWEQMV